MAQPKSSPTTTDVQITTHGDVMAADIEHARNAIAIVASHASRPVLLATCHLQIDRDPARQRPCEARATLDVSGRPVRAHVAAEEMALAIDRLQGRLRRRLADLAETRTGRRRRSGRAEPGAWHHGDLHAERPDYYPRPAEERRLLQHASYSPEPIDPDQAAWELHLLDERFHLFVDAATGAEAVVQRLDDGTWQLQQVIPDPQAEARAAIPLGVDPTPAPRLDPAAARAVLDLTDTPFVFYVDPSDDRGRVLYRRYDGNYGLIEPPDAAPGQNRTG
jgi:hypothetical protein